jgi:hypothetical protein
MLGLAQFDAADLPGDRLRQWRELQPTDPLVRRDPFLDVREDRPCGLGARVAARGEHDVGFRHREPQRIRARNDRGFGDRRVLDQHALELERTDPVVRGLEHVVGAPDEREVAVRVAHGDVAGVIVTVVHRRRGALRVVEIAGRDPGRAVTEVDADLALVGGLAVRVEQRDPIAGQRQTHRAGFDASTRRIPDHRGRLGLPVAVAHREAPRAPDLLDHLGIQWLAGADRLAQRDRPATDVVLDQHAPHGRRRAERRHAAADQLIEQLHRVESIVVIRKHGRSGVPRREHAGPRVLRPTGRAQVQMHVAGPQADPEHRRQMADRITAVGVRDELRLRGRPGREIEQ